MINFPQKTWRDVDLAGKTVLLRADYNVPMQGGKITDDWRLRASLPTLRLLAKQKCKIIIISHLGRPKHLSALPGERCLASPTIDNKQFSLGPIAKTLGEMLGSNVGFVPDCIGDKVKIASKKLAVGEVLLLENLRFYRGEEKNDPDFARQLVKSTGAQVFIQDGYGVVHRAHASTDAITDFLPSVAGPLVEQEWLSIEGTVKNPNRPLVAVVGGVKIIDKTPLIKKLINQADYVIVGGAIANNFLMAQNFSVGASVWSPEADGVVNKIFVQAKKKFGQSWKQNFVLPVDVAVSANGNKNGARRVVARGNVKPNNAIYDIGTRSINHISQIASRAGTVIWNGTLGIAEEPNFSYGSARLALTLANNPQIHSLICGGDTVDFVRNWDNLNGGSFSYLSTGGGAALSQIAGEKLPGIEALL